jgi:hypothetical protein
MHKKAIGHFEVTTFEDSESVNIEFHYNNSQSAHLHLRTNEDLADLRYLVECVLNEQSRRAALRR